MWHQMSWFTIVVIVCLMIALIVINVRAIVRVMRAVRTLPEAWREGRRRARERRGARPV